MANTTSAKKAARKAVHRAQINKARLTRVKTEVRRVEEAIEAGSADAARAALRLVEPVLVRAAQKNVLHKRNASRKVSRLAARVNAMTAK